MSQTVPIHDFSLINDTEPLFEIFTYSPLTVITPILAANFEPHRHKFYELMYLTGGKGEHIIDFEHHELRPPVLYFLSPEQVHFWNLTEKIEGYVFLFKEDFLLSSMFGGGTDEISFFQDMMDSPSFSLNPAHLAKLEPLIEAMLFETERKDAAKRSVLQAYFHIFLVSIQRICSRTQESSGEISLVRQFKKLISSHISCNADVQSCAKTLGVSLTHLRNTLREQTGKSPGQIIRQGVVMEAKRLLIHTNLSAAEIAYSLDFEDPSYFGRYFKREAGVSPSTFKRQITEKYHLKVV